MNKKILALLLAFAMLFSTVSTVFANEAVTTTAAISADAEALKTMNVLQGAGNGVTAEYLATTPDRLQSAVMFLRLKGLEDEAKAFTGTDNFADGNIAWAEGRAIMAYLKAHPELGWVGINSNGQTVFAPYEKIETAQYYKVMLEALGYKQNSASVVGDFAWSEVMTFAASKGLVKLAGNTNFTVNDFATATVEALKAEVKGTGKTLVASLVEAGKVSAEAAAAAGLIGATTTDAVLKSAKAIGNTAVEVEFTAEVAKAFAENAANYSIVEKDTTTALAVNAAVLDGTKKVVLETAAQTAGKAYTVKVGEVSINFGGKAKVTGAPELTKVAGTDTETVELTFDKVLDLASATNTANYTIAGVTVEKAALDSARKVVTLTTKGMVSGRSYTVKVTNIASVDGAVLKSASKTFYSKSDKVAPKVVSATADTFKRVIVKYDELVTKESAENIANYTIKAGTTELAIESIADVTESSDNVTTVEITTAAQKTGTRYELSVINVVDQSVLANKITRASKASFTGKAEDKSAPVFSGFSYYGRNKVVVNFTDGSRLDKASALNAENYAFNNDIAIEKVELLPDADNSFRSVLLTTSEFGAKSSYQLAVAGVADEYGNVMKEKKVTATYIKADAIASARVEKVAATKSTEIVISFSKEINATTAKDVANYSIDGEIGTPLTAKVASDSKSVTLAVSELEAGKKYVVTINGVADLAGNVLVNVKPSFVAPTTENDLDAPTIDEISALNNTVVRVRFSEPIANPTSAQITIREFGKTTGAVTLTGKVTYDEGTVVEFSDATLTDVQYEVISVNNSIADKAGNKLVLGAELPSFYGSSEAAANLDFSWEQTAVNQFKLTFSEKVDTKAATFAGLNVRVDSDDETVAYVESTSALKVDREFKADINGTFVSFHGVAINNLDGTQTALIASLEDTEKPYIEKVEATNRNTIVVTFNEDMRSTGSYAVSYFDENGKEKTVAVNSPAFVSNTKNKVKLELSSGVLDSAITYTLKVTSGAYDLAGNSSEKNEEYSFVGSDLAKSADYISGVEVVNGTSVIAYATNWTSGSKTVTVKTGTPAVTLVTGTVAKDAAVAFATYSIDGETVPLAAFAKDAKYTVEIGTLSYQFNGVVESGISVVKSATADSFDISYSDMKAGDIIVVVGDKLTGTTTDNDAYELQDSDINTGYWTVDPTQDTIDVLVIRDGQVILYNTGIDTTTL